MDKSLMAEMARTLQETTVMLTVLQAQMHAVVAVSPSRAALISAYEQRMERHFSNGLGSALPDAFLERLTQAHQRALKEMQSAP